MAETLPPEGRAGFLVQRFVVLAEDVVGAVPDVGGLAVVADLVQAEEEAAMVRVKPVLVGLGGTARQQHIAGRGIEDVVERLEGVEVILGIVRQR